jgi:predicted O-linked N-acetylglucosamine transferase (SPINDLY family)
MSRRRNRKSITRKQKISDQLKTARRAFAEGRLGKAERSLRLALKHGPQDGAAQNLLAMVLASQHRYAESETLLLALLRNQPNHLSAHVNLGRLYQLSGKLVESESVLRKALILSPNAVNVHLNLGVVLQLKGQHDLALAAYERCIQLQPDLAQAWFNRGTLLEEDFDFASAYQSYREALRLDPRHYEANGNFLMSQHYACPYSPEAARDSSFAFGDLLATTPKLPPRHPPDGDPVRRLKVGLVSADLRNHPVGWFLQDVVPALDPVEVSLHAYANSPHFDALSERLRPYFAAWRQVDTLNDKELAQRIRQDGIDILIDLSGHTRGNRLPVFARRPAPIQLSWLGYYATTGLHEMDYLMADKVCAPVQDTSLYRERVWRLPHSRLFLFRPPASEARPRHGREFCFGSFQTLAKINSEVLALWREILGQLPQARLRIQSRELGDPRRRRRFEERIGPFFDPARVDLLAPCPYADYLAAYGEVDLVLDTFPFPGGTTTVEALWQGVPTLSLVRPGILGRQGEGLLRAAGLDEWVCEHESDYLARALHWAQPRQQAALQALRQELPGRLLERPAADAKCCARDLATALRSMCRRYCANDPA